MTDSPSRMKVNRYYVIAAVWAGLILFATLASGHTLHSFVWFDIFTYDKPIHATLFGAQAWWLIKGRTQTAFTRYLQIVLFACMASAAYGVLTEILQAIFVMQGRSFDYMDMVADFLGCAAVYGWCAWKRIDVD